ncbi:MAG: hypothetical protein IPI61_11205 [Syntrophaceae bacterium]|nr:hypothetical protein [Syntrophaceae bacterium]
MANSSVMDALGRRTKPEGDSACGPRFKTGLHESEVWGLLKMWNNSKVKPSLGEVELSKIYDSVRAMEQKGKKKILDIDSFLYTKESIAAEYKKKYQKVSFAGGSPKAPGRNHGRRTSWGKPIYWEEYRHLARLPS